MLKRAARILLMAVLTEPVAAISLHCLKDRTVRAGEHYARWSLATLAPCDSMPWPAWWSVPIVLIFFSAFYICWQNRKRVSLELQHLRTRIAADLHDDVGASLSQLAIMS